MSSLRKLFPLCFACCSEMLTFSCERTQPQPIPLSSHLFMNWVLIKVYVLLIIFIASFTVGMCLILIKFINFQDLFLCDPKSIKFEGKLMKVANVFTSWADRAIFFVANLVGFLHNFLLNQFVVIICWFQELLHLSMVAWEVLRVIVDNDWDLNFNSTLFA